jgi:hypothetical protein
MANSRRAVITNGALAIVGAFVALPEVVQAALAKPAIKPAVKKPTSATRPIADTLPWLSRPLLQPRVGQTFNIYVKGKGWTAARLLRVDDIACAAAAGAIGSPDCFTAVFDGPTTMSLPQGTYSVNNAGLGTFTLFLVPGGKANRRTVFTATVNRIRS